MLQFDLDGLSDDAIAQMISVRCAPYGAVKAINIIREPSDVADALAFVAMSTPEEIHKVIGALGGHRFAGTVVLPLKRYAPRQ
jgi:hypothetical protein